MKINRHTVTVEYRAEPGEDWGSIEVINFSTAEAARAFAARQKKLSCVITARYENGN